MIHDLEKILKYVADCHKWTAWEINDYTVILQVKFKQANGFLELIYNQLVSFEALTLVLLLIIHFIFWDT